MTFLPRVLRSNPLYKAFLLCVLAFGWWHWYEAAPQAQAQEPVSVAAGELHNNAAVLSAAPARKQGRAVALDREERALAALPLRTPRREHTATLLTDGRVLVVGGRNDGGALATAEIYNPTNGVWTAARSLLQARHLHAAVLLRNGQVLVVGGAAGGVDLSSAEIYDPLQDTWTTAAALSRARQKHTATRLSDGTVLVAGGENASGVTRTSELFSAGQWTPAGDLVSSRAEHAAVLLPNGVVLVAGGRNSAGTLNGAEVYDPSSRRWRATRGLERARRLHTLTLLATGEVVAAGGHDGNGPTGHSELFTPRTQTWTRVGELNHTRYAHAAVLLPNGKLLVAGGAGNATLSSTEVFDPATRQWTFSNIMDAARVDFTATLLASGRVLISGGSNGVGATLGSAELFEQTAASWSLTRSANGAQTVLTGGHLAHTATLLTDGRVLVAGGYGLTVATAEIYDPHTRLWTSAAPVNLQQRASHTATLLPNGKVLVAGGYRIVNNREVYLETAEVYDPQARTWTRTNNNMRQRRAYHTATLLRDGRVLVGGGRSETSIHSDGDIYDPLTNQWTPLLRLLNSARREHTATLLADGRVLFAGGQIGDGNVLNTAEVYEPQSGKVSFTLRPMPARRAVHNAVLLPDNRVLVMGGTDGSPAVPRTIANVDLYDPATNDWTAAAAMRDARYFFTATLLETGKVLVAGGAGTQYLARSELYDPITNQWTATDEMESGARAYHTATLLLDGQVLVAGGLLNANTVRRSSELYDPGLNFSDAARPVITGAQWFSGFASNELTVNGLRFQGVSEAANGGQQTSPTNHPVLLVRSLANDQISFPSADTGLGPESWSNTRFTSRPGPNLPAGYARVTIIANGIPSRAHTIRFGQFETEFASITGRISDNYGAPFPATLVLNSNAGIQQTTRTDANGVYAFANLPLQPADSSAPITYSVSIQSQAGVTFSPAAASFTTTPRPLGSEQPPSGNDFTFNATASGALGSVAGRVECPNNNCVGVRLRLASAELPPGCDNCLQTVRADGSYQFTLLTRGAQYELIPESADHIFDPELHSFFLNGDEVRNFRASLRGGPTIGAPTAITAAATNITTGAATLNGTVNPNGAPTQAAFEYATNPDFAGAQTVGAGALAGNTTQAMTANLTGLTSGATYFFRVVAANSVGTVRGAPLSFTTTATTTCSYAISVNAQYFSANGGPGFVGVTTAAGCAWAAISNVEWITVTSGANGSGSNTVTYNVAANTGSFRSGTLTIAGQTFTVNQEGGSCAFSISATGQSFNNSGGAGNVNVTTAAGCAWTAASNTDWLAITGGASGNGNGAVTFSVAANTGPPRNGTLTIAGQTFTVTQEGGCAFSISPTSQSFNSNGGAGSIAVTAGNGCGWTATSNADWIAVTAGANGTGNGTVTFTVAANTGAQRTGTLTVAGQLFTVTQESLSCSFAINPTSQNFNSDGGAGNVAVTTAAGCAWTATSNATWITINSGASGNGDGTVNFSVAANTGAQRSGTLTVAGQTFTITQDSINCTFAINPTSQSFNSSGGAGSVAVTATTGCAWTAATDAAWINITAGASGNGSGTVNFTVAANASPQRTATLTIAGQTFTVTQESGCQFTINPTSQNFNSDGGAGSVAVLAGAGCAWTATSNAVWITITSGASGNGDGAVGFNVAANTEAQRTGTLTIAGQTFTVTQEGVGCGFVVNLSSQSFGRDGGTGTATVATTVGCAWTATSNAAWITINSGASGSGNGTVTFTVAPNTGRGRAGTLTIAGQTFTIAQAAIGGTTKADFDGDGKTDLSVWRGLESLWLIINSSDGTPRTITWGALQPHGDVLVPGDYDGDGRTDAAVWRPAEGIWYILRSSNGTALIQQFGLPGDVPVPGDYDGDGKTDLAFWRFSQRVWFVRRSSDNTSRRFTIADAEAEDAPVAADYDGDGRTDFAFFNPTLGRWRYIQSSDNAVVEGFLGGAGDVPVPGDYDGDRRADFAVWRESTGQYLILHNATGIARTEQFGPAQTAFPGIAAPGDYDGDGKTDVAVWQAIAGDWYIVYSSTGERSAPLRHGQSNDTAVPAHGVR